MEKDRGVFGSRIGFVMAAAGSAVGVGNIWGFPTQAASNGGGAFLLIYLLLVFVLGYPMLVAELLIGRHGQSSTVGSLSKIAPGKNGRRAGVFFGVAGMLAGILILSFYGIVAGWFLGSGAEPIASLLGFDGAATWFSSFSVSRNITMATVFAVLTALILFAGVRDGIEKWSRRLMPMLFILLGGSVIFMLFQEGAVEGLRRYLVPDFSRIGHMGLILDALGQAFFSLSIGVGTMMIYGSYLSRNENIPRLASQVVLVDTGVAFLAGLLIIPAMYVAANNGVAIFDEAGNLLNSDTLVLTVLPGLFSTMGGLRAPVSLVFFALMSIAALTSSISMLEPAVAYLVEEKKQPRRRAVILVSGLTLAISILICLNFGLLFGFIIDLSTKILQPTLSLVFALYVGWVWKRDSVLSEIRQGSPQIENSVFWKIWPFYVKFICPVLVTVLIIRSFWG